MDVRVGKAVIVATENEWPQWGRLNNGSVSQLTTETGRS